MGHFPLWTMVIYGVCMMLANLPGARARLATAALGAAGCGAMLCSAARHSLSSARAALDRRACSISLQEALPYMKTGDILLFRAREGGFGKFHPLVAAWKDLRWSIGMAADGACILHTGVVIRGEKGELFAHENNPSRHYDATLGKRVHGTQLIPLETRIQKYRGDIWWYPLASPLTEEQCRLARQCVLEMEHCGHYIPWSAWGAALFCPRYEGYLPESPPPDLIYCARASAEMLLRLGVLHSKPEGDLWFPSDLSPSARCDLFVQHYRPHAAYKIK